jgi:ABC-2 type transport system permease protein
MILAVARTHFWKLRRDRAALVLTFVVPIVFFSVFALIFRGGGGTRRVPLAVVDEDRSDASGQLLEGLRREAGLGMIETYSGGGSEEKLPFDAKSAEQAVRDGDVPVALVIPRGFGAAPLRFGPGAARPKLRLLSDSSDPIASQVVAGLLQKVVMTSMPSSLAEAGIEQVARWGGGLTEEQRARLKTNLEGLRRLQKQGDTGGAGASGGLVEIETRDLLGETKKKPAVASLAAGLGVLFLLFSASGAGGALIEEAESGTLERVLSTNVSMGRLLSGKLLYLATMAVLQLTVMFIWGAAVFGLELASHLPGYAVMTVVTALATSSFGLLLAAASRSRMQLVALSNLSILVMSALGGSMFPRYLMPKPMQKIGLVTLNAWSLDGFLKVFWREEPLFNLWPQVGMLLLFAVLFFAAARRLARRWEAA